MKTSIRTVCVNQDVTGGYTSPKLSVNGFISYAIQVNLNGSPSGELTLEASGDGDTWVEIDGTYTIVTQADSFIFNVPYPGYEWVRVKFVDGGSTNPKATIYLNGK
jgi:hypothetical protein